VLFDGKRQKVLTKVVAIIAIVAFAGFGLVAGGLAVSGGCASADPLQQAVDEARTRVTTAQANLETAQKAATASPRSTAAKADVAQAKLDLGTAQSSLAQARLAVSATDPQALADAQAAVRNAPGDQDVVLSLVTISTSQNNPSAALPAIAAYTRINPRDAQMYAYWGQLAEQAGQRNQAILAYQRFLQLAPQDTVAPDIRQRLAELTRQGTATG
jgi:tetratricopeptide (TPR) repeat protein